MKRQNIILLIFGTTIAACTVQKQQQIDRASAPVVTPCVFQNLQPAPSWICNVPVTDIDIQAVGMAEKSAAGINYMKDIARIAALSDLSEKLKVRVDAQLKQCTELTSGDRLLSIDSKKSDIEIVVNKSLGNSPVRKFLVGPEGRIYVLIGLDKLGTKKLIEKSIIEPFKGDLALCQGYKIQK